MDARLASDRKTLRVSGELYQLVQFFEIWQTSAWPEWRTHSNSVARDQLEGSIATWASGVAQFSTDKEYHDGIRSALAAFNLPVVDLDGV